MKHQDSHETPSLIFLEKSSAAILLGSLRVKDIVCWKNWGWCHLNLRVFLYTNKTASKKGIWRKGLRFCPLTMENS